MLSSSATAVKSSPIFDRKIEETIAGLQRSFIKKLQTIGEANAESIAEYIAAMKSEVNLSNNYRRDIIEVLYRFSEYNSNKPFRDSTRAKILAFLETFRKILDVSRSTAQMDRNLQHFQDSFI